MKDKTTISYKIADRYSIKLKNSSNYVELNVFTKFAAHKKIN